MLSVLLRRLQLVGSELVTLTSGRMTVSKYKKQKERALEKRLIAAFGNLNAASYKHGHARFSEGASGDLQEGSNGRLLIIK